MVFTQAYINLDTNTIRVWHNDVLVLEVYSEDLRNWDEEAPEQTNSIGNFVWGCYLDSKEPRRRCKNCR